MKKIFFTLLVGLLFLFGCVTSKKVEKKVEIPTQTLETEVPSLWKQELFPTLKVGDRIFFYNSSEIVLEGNYFITKTSVTNGTINKFNNIVTIVKKVPKMTPGMVSSLIIKNKQIVDMFVSFSNQDETYRLNFKLKKDGTFTLNGNTKFHFNGKETTVQSSVSGEECLLLVFFNYEEKVNELSEEAEGVFLK